ncbi:MAG: hypothetical protein H6709_22345 [Kofleriaceae bacterium]|nr:hypothetical protein [Kofleriaceae bacterium]MCB9574822.1 hypothetical protein [Kofleriaceae bacterium]
MTEAYAYVALAAMLAVVLWRPHGWGPPLGAAVAVLVAVAAGLVDRDDPRQAALVLWRPFITLTSIMLMTSAAERLGVIERLAAFIEPRTRGPVRHAFRITFVTSAVVAAVLSNDAAILLLTPTVLALIRAVYPRRHGKFLQAFAFAVFAGAGVAPLVVSNPMNLVVAERAGIGFNRYALTMIPVALAGWLVTYALLARLFRAPLVDEAPALGAWAAPRALTPAARLVVIVLGVVLASYPVAAYLGGPLWAVAAAGAAVCTAASVGAGVRLRALASGVSWNVFPFLGGVLVLALAMQHAGVVDRLASLFVPGPARLPIIGAVAAAGSALLNNHPMAILDALALERTVGAGHVDVLAALIGGDLGPRLLPSGSLAGILWMDVLRRHDVDVGVGTFARVGVVLTVPTLLVSILVLWLVGA